jgi:shikimate dehydrogenase
MITGRTKVLVALADPIEHVRAPDMLNAAFASRGMDAVLVPMHVRPEELPDVVRGLRAWQNCVGGVVTMPHKAAIGRELDSVRPDAACVGAVNVFRRERGRLVGDNFDGPGFIDGLNSRGISVVERRVFLAGAGGAASAIAFAVGKHGARSLTITNRSRERAEELASRVQKEWPRLVTTVAGPSPKGHDLVVNATSLGRSSSDPLPVDVDGLEANAICVDILMQSEPSPFLKAAAARGCTVQSGEVMLAHQLEAMLDFWR